MPPWAKRRLRAFPWPRGDNPFDRYRLYFAWVSENPGVTAFPFFCIVAFTTSGLQVFFRKVSTIHHIDQADRRACRQVVR